MNQHFPFFQIFDFKKQVLLFSDQQRQKTNSGYHFGATMEIFSRRINLQELENRKYFLKLPQAQKIWLNKNCPVWNEGSSRSANSAFSNWPSCSKRCTAYSLSKYANFSPVSKILSSREKLFQILINLVSKYSPFIGDHLVVVLDYFGWI